MLNSKCLSEVVKDPKKALFVSKTKINLTFCDIETIDEVPKTFQKLDKLHLSHNKISSLSGIQQFKGITHLSLSFNNIKDWEQLLKLENKDALLELNVKGNPFTAHPNHLFLIIDKFPNLQRIDDLKISKEDRYYLQNYWLLSGKILPFFIQLQTDLNVIEENLKRMKLTAEIRGREREMSTKERKENMQKLEDLYYKMTQDLKNESFLIEIHRIVEKYTKFQSQSPTLTLKILDNIVQGLYENRLEHLVFERKTLYANYRKLFNDIMLRYFSAHNTSLDRFLTQRVLETPSYDHWRFAEDNDYAFDCVLYEFYRLMPSQASISHTINFTFNSEQEEKRVNRWENPKEKVITSLDVGPNNPDFLRNVCTTHFPIFPLNLEYNNNVLKTLLAQLEIIQNVAIDIYMLLDANSPVIRNLGTYRIFLESRSQVNRPRSETPPDYRIEEYSVEYQEGSHSKKLQSTKNKTERTGSLDNIELGSPDKKLFKRDYFLIPRSGNKDSKGQKSKGQSPANRFAESSPDRVPLGFSRLKVNEHLSGGKAERAKRELQKRKNVLSLLLIVKFDSNVKIHTSEGFYNLKYYAQQQRKVERKRILEEFYNDIKRKLGKSVKSRIFERWSQRARDNKKALNAFREIRYTRMRNSFRLFATAYQRSREVIDAYYTKNLSLKVFYSILNLRMKKRATLKKVLDSFLQKKHRIVNLYLSRWRLVNSAQKYADKKAGLEAMRSLSRTRTMKKRDSSQDRRSSRILKEEAFKLQSKKTMRELEPYLSDAKDIFRKCSACYYEI